MASAASQISAQAPVRTPQPSNGNAAGTPAAGEPSLFSQLMADIAAEQPSEPVSDIAATANAPAEPPPQDGEQPQIVLPLLNPDLADRDVAGLDKVPVKTEDEGADNKSAPGENSADSPAATTDMTAQMQLALMMPVTTPVHTAAPMVSVTDTDGEDADTVEETAPPAANAAPVQPYQEQDKDLAAAPDAAAPQKPAQNDGQTAATQAAAPQDMVQPDGSLSANIQQTIAAQPGAKQDTKQATASEQSAQAAPDETKEAAAAPVVSTARPVPPKPGVKSGADATTFAANPRGARTDARIETGGEAPRASQTDAVVAAPPPPVQPQAANNVPPANLAGPLVVTITEPAAATAKSGTVDKASASDGPEPNMDFLAVQIAAKSQSGAKQFDIRLDPPELGRAGVRVSSDATGKALKDALN